MQKKKIFAFILAALLLFCYAAPAFAETTSISDEDIPYDFFEYYSGGSWHDLNTPVHRDSSGNYAYCLDHEKEPPGSSTVYSDFDAAVVFNPTTIRGIQAILDHGYPVSTGGIGSSKAHYATANAIRWWIKESTGIGYNFMTPGSSNLRAKSDAADCWAFAQELLGYARAGATTGGSSSGGEIVVSSMNLTWQLVGGQLQTSLTVQAPDGYTITPSTNQINISGYTGGTRDTLTITAPLSLMGTDVSLFIQGKGSAGAATSASLYWFEPNQSAKQRVVVTRLTSGGEPDSGYVYITGEFYELTVNKTDSYTGAALDGATFQLTTGGRAVGLTQTGTGRYTADGSATTFTTSGGTAIISGLPAGDYQLVELSAPSTAYSVAAPGAIRLYGNGTATVPNTPTKVVVQKLNGLTGQPMPGVTFTLTDTSGNPVGLSKHADGTYRPSNGGSNAFTVDSAGKATIMYLPKGKYIIHEPASDGYAELGSETFEVDGVTTIEAINEPLMLKLTKVDSFTGKTLPNIPFDLLDASGNSVRLSKVSDGVYHYDANGSTGFTTGADGTASIYYIHAGTYTVRETANVGLGYTDAKDASVTVSRKNGISNPATVRFANDPTTLEFTKLDELTKEVLDGATFQLKDSTGAVVALKQVEAGSYRPDTGGGATFTTKGGKAVIRYLVPGQYTITEVSAPTGYAKDTDKSININKYNDTSNSAKVTMQDKPLALEFTKTDGMTGALLDGCSFTLKDSSGGTIKLRKISDGVYTPDTAGGDTFTTSKGKATIGPISPGTYTVAETSSAPGYAKGEDVSITVTNQNVTTNPAKGDMANAPLAVTIRKIDSETKQPFGGTVFRLLDADGAVMKISPIAEKAGWYQYDRAGEEAFTMPASGSVTISGLPEGAYQLEETQEIGGYKRLTELIPVAVDAAHTYANPGEVTVENEPLILQVAKMDGYNNKPLPNVSFSIQNEDGNELKFAKVSEGEYRVSKDGLTLFETGADGIATIKLIPEGKYVLHETENPGFGKVDPVPFTVDQNSAGETPTAVGVENFPLCVEIAKVDKIDKSPLANVPFKLIDSSGNALLFAKQEEGAHHVDSNGSEIFKTDMNGKALLRYVPAGTYTLIEQEYNGYGTHAPVQITVTVENKPENPFKIKLENIPLAMDLIKTDSYTTKPMEASFKLLDADGKEIPLALMSDGTYRPMDVALRQQEQQKALAEKEAQEDDPDSVPDEGDSAAGETEGDPDNLNSDNNEDEQKPGAPENKPEAEPYEPATFKEKADFLKTDAKGFARIEYLSPGKYTLKEEPIPGYVPLNGVEFEVTNAHTFTQPLEYAVKNIPTRLLIEKQDGYLGNPLMGAKFKLTDAVGKDIQLFKQADGNLRPAVEGEIGAEVFALNDAAQAVILYLEAGVYTLTEVEGPAGYGIAAPIQVEVGTEAALELALAARAEGDDSPFIAESSVAVIDMPLALKISKVHAKSGKPLQGAAFALKAQGNLSTPLRFTMKDGVYWFDEKGAITQIDMDKNAEALVLGLPVGRYVLEETVVPEHFFPAVPQNVEITVAHTSASPQTAVVQNTPTVKLGIDSDKFNTVIGIGVLLLAMLIGCCAYFVRLRKQV